VALWGLNYVVGKEVLGTIAPLPGTFLRAVLASGVCFGLLATGRDWRMPRRADWGRLVGIGLLGLSVNGVLWSEGLHRTSASHAGLIPTLTPLLVFVASHLLGHLRITGRDLGGLGLGLAGAALIVGAPLLSGGDSGGSDLLGDLMTAGSAAIWGLWMLAATPLLRRYGTLATTTWLTAISAMGLLPLALPDLLAADWSRLDLAGLAYWAIGAGVVGGLLWYGAVRRLGAARTAIYSNLQSFFAVLFAALFLGEHVEVLALMGGLAAIAGVLLTRRVRAEEGERAEA
jgi:drug/metabolite transporter (DMT)-like permease